MPWETLQTLSQTLAWTLLHFLWQGAIVGVIYLLACRWAGTTRQQHALALAALLVVLALPVITFQQLHGAEKAVAATPALAQGVASTAVMATADVSPQVVATPSGSGSSANWAYLLVFAWFAGAMAIAFRLLRDWRLLRGAISSGSDPAPELLAMLERQIRRIGVARPVRLRLTARITTAGVYGWLRPVILLPTALALCMPRDQLETLLAHELAHIRRADFLGNSLALLARTLLYFHPVVHRICKDLERTREQLCDDLVVAMDIDRIKYARALSTAESFRQRVTVPVPLLTATGGELSERVHRILDLPTDGHSGRERAPLLLALTAVAVAVLGLGGSETSRLLSIARPEFQAVYLALAAPQPPRIAAPDIDWSADAPALPTLATPAPVDVQAPVAGDFVIPAPVLAAPAVTTSVPAPPAVANMQADPVAPMAAADFDAGAVSPPATEYGPESAVAAPETSRTPMARKPRVMRQVQPTYPRDARLDGIEGSVTLAYRVDADGYPREIRVVSANPAGPFEKATIDALERWRFAPGDAGEFQQSFDFLLGTDERCAPRIGTRICRPGRD